MTNLEKMVFVFNTIHITKLANSMKFSSESPQIRYMDSFSLYHTYQCVHNFQLIYFMIFCIFFFQCLYLEKCGLRKNVKVSD